MGTAYMTSYIYDCEIAFNTADASGRSFDITHETIEYIMVEHDYRKNIMPILYMKAKILPSVYNLMVAQQGKAKIYAKLFCMRDKGSTSSVQKKVFADEFDYFLSDDPNATRKLEAPHEEAGNAYKECIIGMIKIDLQKKNKKTFEGVYKNTDSITLLHAATQDFRMVIQPLDYNTKYDKFVCPNMDSIAQFISYLNKTNAFYEGSYMYYMDHDKVYLRSNDGSYIDAKDGHFKYIAMDIRDLTMYDALSIGMVEDPIQDAYIIYVSATDAQIIIDRVTPSVIGNVDTVKPEDGSKLDAASVDTSIITNVGTADADMITTSSDPNAAKHMTVKIAERSDTLIINKIAMDSRVFTPNKQYLLCNYEDNPKYCGVYYMVNKKEIYLRNGDHMACQLTVTFKKCADFVK